MTMKKLLAVAVLHILTLAVLFASAVAFAGERSQDMKTLTTTASTACTTVPYGAFTFWCTEDVYYALCSSASCTVSATKGIKWLKDASRDTTSTNGGNYFCAVQVTDGGTCVVAPFVVR